MQRNQSNGSRKICKRSVERFDRVSKRSKCKKIFSLFRPIPVSDEATNIRWRKILKLPRINFSNETFRIINSRSYPSAVTKADRIIRSYPQRRRRNPIESTPLRQYTRLVPSQTAPRNAKAKQRKRVQAETEKPPRGKQRGRTGRAKRPETRGTSKSRWWPCWGNSEGGERLEAFQPHVEIREIGVWRTMQRHKGEKKKGEGKKGNTMEEERQKR